MVQGRSQGGRPGFTLIELVVVLVILAAVAALLVPRLGFLKSQADSATAGAGAASIVSNLETYKLTVGSYPLGMDSLLPSSSGTAPYTNLWEHIISAGPSTTINLGPKPNLTGASISSGGVNPGGYAGSFGHAFSPPTGGYYLFDHSATATDFTNSAVTQRTAATTSALGNVAHVTGEEMIKACGYPGGTLPTGVKLIAFGVGPNTASIGTTMASAPRHSAQTDQYYGRYIAVFAIYDSGKSGELKTVLDSFAGTIDGNVSAYKKSAPDKLPTPTP